MNHPLDDLPGAAVAAAEVTAVDTPALDEDGLWSSFVNATTSSTYTRAWLGILCRQIPDVAGALVLLGNPDSGQYTPSAFWPDDGIDFNYLTGVAEQALRERRAVVTQDPGAGDGGRAPAGLHIAYPVMVSGAMYGVAALDMLGRGPEAVQRDLRRLHWGMAWLEVLIRRQNEGGEVRNRDQIITVLELVAAALDEVRFQGACTAFVTELAHRLDCDRASVGFRRHGQTRIQAISHSATFGQELNLVRLLGEAMDEAVDQETVIRYPADRDGRIATRAHRELAGLQQAQGELATVPVPVAGEYVLAMTLERPEGRPFSAEEMELCETAGALVGPVLVLKRDEERWLIVKAFHALREQFVRLFGPGHLVRKSVLLALTLVALFLVFAKGDYRITADAVVEGAVQRSVVAPFEGFIRSAEVRAGDLVEEEQVLAVLDDQDLKLERLRLSTQRTQLVREQREAVANKERAQVKVLGAQIQQTEAQIALLDEQLARTRLRAPFAGVVVSGDLSQSLGAPVKPGEVLFEIAPLDAYRLILQVDEQDITDTGAGQTGNLVLNAMPERTLAFDVERITPVSTPSEGRNYFRVEAILAQTPDALRPGMQGVGKVLVGERHLAWIWTRRMVDWLRLKLWAWWP